MKTVVFLVALAGLAWFYLYNPAADRLMLQAADNVQRMIHGAPQQDPLYGEARIDYQAGSRRMQLVAVARFKPWDSCRRRLRQITAGMVATCERCELRSIECDGSGDERYYPMLRGEDSVTRYVHVRSGADDFRTMAIVLWGLTDREATRWCNGFVGGLREAQARLPDTAWRFSETGRQLRTLGNIEVECR